MNAKFLSCIAFLILLVGCGLKKHKPKDGYSVFADSYGIMTCEAPSTMSVYDEQKRNGTYYSWALHDEQRAICFMEGDKQSQWNIYKCATDYAQQIGENYYCSERTDSLIALSSAPWAPRPFVVVSSLIRDGRHFMCVSWGFTTEEHKKITKTFQYRPQGR